MLQALSRIGSALAGSGDAGPGNGENGVFEREFQTGLFGETSNTSIACGESSLYLLNEREGLSDNN